MEELSERAHGAGRRINAGSAWLAKRGIGPAPAPGGGRRFGLSIGAGQ